MSNSTDQNEIRPIRDIENVRRRPSMYFGDLEVTTIPNCLAKEAFCLAIDEIIANRCTRLIVEFSQNGFASITHNGNSLGIDLDPRFPKMSEMEAVAEIMGFCAEHAASDYVHTNVCKNGMTALNALCERFELHNFHHGKHYLLAYNHGILQTTMNSIGETKRSGVMVRFKPDNTMVKHIKFDAQQLKDWFLSLPIDCSKVSMDWND